LIPVVALLVPGLVAGEEPRQKADAEKSTALPAKGRPLFDVGEFIKEYDTNKDGALSKEELPERFRHNFAQLDTNKDGKLSRDELDKGVAYLQPPRRPSDFVFVLVEMSDCDECCAEELQHIYDVLRKLDKDRSGKIDVGELQAMREELVSKRVDGIIAQLDLNKDGKISQEEARGMIKRHFAELDTNKDGSITRDELFQAASQKPAKLKSKGAPAEKPES